MNNSKILITGADGFIGSHLTEALVRKGYNIHAVAMYNSFNSWGRLDYCGADVIGNFKISVGDIVQLIAEAMSTEIEIIAGEVRLRPENSEVESLLADNAKARQLYDWQPSYGGREGFKRGLSETAEWFAQHDNLCCYKADIYNI